MPLEPHPDDGFPTAQAELARAARVLVIVIACVALVLCAAVAVVIWRLW